MAMVKWADKANHVEFLTINLEHRIDINNLIRSTDASTDEISDSYRDIAVDIYKSKRRSVK